MAEVEFQQVQDALEVRRLDDADVRDLQRMRQQMQIRPLVVQDRAANEIQVEFVDVEHEIDDGVVGDHIERDVAIAESEIEIDERDGVLGFGGKSSGEIDGQRRAAHAAAGAEQADNLRRAAPMGAVTPPDVCGP